MVFKIVLGLLTVSITLAQSNLQPQQRAFGNNGHPVNHQNPNRNFSPGQSGQNVPPGRFSSVGRNEPVFREPGFHNNAPSNNQFEGHSGRFNQEPRNPQGPQNSFRNEPNQQHGSNSFAPRESFQSGPQQPSQNFRQSQASSGAFHSQGPDPALSGRPGSSFRIPGRVPERIPSNLPQRAIILTEDDLEDDGNFALVAVERPRGSQFSQNRNQPSLFDRSPVNPPELFHQSRFQSSGGSQPEFHPATTGNQRFSVSNGQGFRSQAGFPEVKVIQKPRQIDNRPQIVRIISEDDLEQPDLPDRIVRPHFIERPHVREIDSFSRPRGSRIPPTSAEALLVDSFGRPVVKAKFEEPDSDRFDRPTFVARIPSRFSSNPFLNGRSGQEPLPASALSQLGGPAGKNSGNFHPRNPPSAPSSQLVDGFGNPVPGNRFSGVHPGNSRPHGGRSNGGSFH